MEEAIALMIVFGFIGAKELWGRGSRASAIDRLRAAAKAVILSREKRYREVNRTRVPYTAVPLKAVQAFYDSAERASPLLGKEATTIITKLVMKKHLYLDKCCEDHKSFVALVKAFDALLLYSAKAESNVINPK